MKRRNIERTTDFSMQISRECGFCGIQGLCRNKQGEYTIAVEAVDMEDDPVEAFSSVIGEEEIFVKSCFAEKIGAIFTILLHKEEAGESFVYIRQYRPDRAAGVAVCTAEEKMSEPAFIGWWKERQYGRQMNSYRNDLNIGTGEKYFDNLLESNGTSWPSGIDGFIAAKDEAGHPTVSAMIKNRIADKCKVKSYDPNRYFGKDYKTWVASIKLAEAIDAPLFLCTYSRKSGQEQYMGIGRIISVNEEGLVFKNGTRPDKNVKKSVEEVKDYLDREILEFR